MIFAGFVWGKVGWQLISAITLTLIAATRAIAARDCIRILELTEQVAVAGLLAVVQGVELRGDLQALSPALKKTVEQVRQHSPVLRTDRALEQELRTCLALTRQQFWDLYD